ncbi:hypothetical protein VSS37_03530 [Candidatus Thiothrix sp. Deng01]|uniref:Uncharacterized protein n=1 Tax=Candidatus Thiothrix phosphatis TaxID=3112415 RepID=A0ABU6CU52_9GAMM|nr:hypothetical protein [Candidatus Thiothrix sp. Deng01]MEB4590042.1 hypothetical protein [Candidatus Thiothrix sp. Deng01]
MSKKVTLTQAQFDALVNGQKPKPVKQQKDKPQPQQKSGGGLDGFSMFLLFVLALLAALYFIPGGGKP